MTLQFEKDLPEPEPNSLREKIISGIRNVYDPDIHVNIYDLGLIYHIETNDPVITITMTLTSPFCPVAEELPIWTREAVEQNVGEGHIIEIKMTFEPPFTPEMMPDDVRFAILGY